jgi:hypothetical protein
MVQVCPLPAISDRSFLKSPIGLPVSYTNCNHIPPVFCEKSNFEVLLVEYLGCRLCPKVIPCFASPGDEVFVALIGPLFVFDVAYEQIQTGSDGFKAFQ